jgi:hypothetical protein
METKDSPPSQHQREKQGQAPLMGLPHKHVARGDVRTRQREKHRHGPPPPPQRPPLTHVRKEPPAAAPEAMDTQRKAHPHNGKEATTCACEGVCVRGRQAHTHTPTLGGGILRFLGPSTSGPSISGPPSNGPSLFGPSSTGPNMIGPSISGPSIRGPSMCGPSSSGPV